MTSQRESEVLIWVIAAILSLATAISVIEFLAKDVMCFASWLHLG